MASSASAHRLPFVLLVVAIFFAATAVGLAFWRGSPPGEAEGLAAECAAPSAGPDGYVVSGVNGTVVAGLTVRPAAPAGGGRTGLVLQLLSPDGPLGGRHPVLVPARSGSTIRLSESTTPGCYTGSGTLAGGQALHVRGLPASAGGPLALRLPEHVRPAAGLVRRARAATTALTAVHERQSVAPSDGAPPVRLGVEYRGRVITERSATGVTRSVQPSWRRTLFWMLPGGIGVPRRIGVEQHAGQSRVVVTGALRDVEGFIRLVIDPRSGHVEQMRFLAAGHIMYSTYDGFEPPS
jgi:hypothetical protein